MLLQFVFKNHKCFYDETVLDLTATKEKRHLNEVFDVNGNKILPLIEIHGANASGKTSLLEALYFMIKTIKTSSKIDINKDLETIPFAFSDKAMKKNSEYEISFVLGDFEYRYGFSINKNGFDEEWLYQRKFSIYSKTEKIVFERSKDNIVFGSKYQKYQKTWELFSNNIETKKLLVLSIVALKEETGLFRNILNFISNIHYREEKLLTNEISINILKHQDKLFSKFQEIIQEFDPCLLGIEIKKANIDTPEELYIIRGVHKNIDNNNINYIPLDNESNGTIKLFNIIPSILANLDTGGILIVDELDVKLHPLLFEKIINMYKDKKINKKNAQIIYTAHSTYLLNSDSLRRDEIYLVEKNNSGESTLFSLSEFRNLRADADYEKKYLTGEFGAIPYNFDDIEDK